MDQKEMEEMQRMSDKYQPELPVRPLNTRFSTHQLTVLGTSDR